MIRGLGIGTSPSAFISHGIATTIIEIDPVVHEFATKYFSLPLNHTAVIRDAIGAVDDMQNTHANNYHYIIHDVFTGGTEPISLFTKEFLTDLRHLLSSDGVIAIVSNVPQGFWALRGDFVDLIRIMLETSSYLQRQQW